MNRKKLSTELRELWIENGHYFGYPECCIKNFCERGFKLTDEQEAVHKHTGFTPCPECSKKILRGEATLESLLVNRICKEPFPNKN
jgi:hypothetical protein